MTVFWLTLIIVYIFGYFARRYSSEIVTANGIVQHSPNKVFACLALFILIVVSGLRAPSGFGVIGDTFTYVRSFVNHVPDTVAEAMENFTLFKGDDGFKLFSSFIKEFVSSDPQVFLLICALITNTLIFIILYKHSAIFELSLFLYITSGMYLVTMNGVRQFLVASVLFFLIKWIVDGRWLLFFSVVLVMSTMHLSALIFIPVYFFVRLNPWSRLVGITLAASVVVLLTFSQIGAFLLGSLEGTQYEHYQEYILASNQGANVMRALIAAVPVVLAYIGRKAIEECNDKLVNILINFSVLNLVFYILAVQNWIFARMTIYFGLSVLLLLPWLIKNLFPKTSTALYNACLFFYFIYYYYEMVITLHMVYRSEFLGFLE